MFADHFFLYSVQVIPGWTEAMQLMVEGDEWELYIPSDMAYGDRGTPGGPIPGGSKSTHCTSRSMYTNSYRSRIASVHGEGVLRSWSCPEFHRGGPREITILCFRK